MNLTPDPQNPNTMSDEDKARMARSLAEFGDISGIILNTTTGLLVAGHQRTSVLTDGKIVAKKLAKPDPDGTTARGHILHLGRQYSYREVAWTPGKAHAALLAANRFGRVGQDDAAALKDILQELDTGEIDMDLTGYDKAIREQMASCDTPMKSVDVSKPPRMAWVLIGVPIGEWGKVSGMAEAAAEIEGSIVETTANDGIKED